MKTIKIKMRKVMMISLVILAISCHRDEVIEESPNLENQALQNENSLVKNQIGLEVAKNLAKNLKNIELREFIKAKSLEKFDGDYNFLIETSRNEKISNNKSDEQIPFSNYLSEGSITDSTEKVKSTNKLMNTIKVNYPLLQIAIPEFNENKITDWDINSTIPLVAYIPINLKDDIIPAFDSEGNYHELSSSKSPEELVIVIKQNERVTIIDSDPSKKSATILKNFGDECEIIEEGFYQNDINEYHFTDQLMNQTSLCSDGGGTGGSGTGGSGSSNDSCDRDRKSGKDRLNRLKFNSMPSFREIAEWHDGALELELNVFYGYGSNEDDVKSVTKRFNGTRDQFKNCSVFNCNPEWFDLYNTEIITWDKEEHSDVMQYVWIEKDGGGELPLSLSFSGKFKGIKIEFKPKLTIKFQDDKVGESLVEYCDNTDGDGYTYNTGLMQFQVKQ